MRIIVGFAAGGPADTVARLIGQWLSERLGQPIVVDNRSGANAQSTPTQIVEKLNQEINAALADPNMKKRLTDLGCAVFAGSSADFGKFIADETEKWAKVIKSAGIKAE